MGKSSMRSKRSFPSDHASDTTIFYFEVKWKNFPRSENTWEVYGVISDTEAMGHYEKEHGSQLFVPPDAGRSKHALAAIECG